MGKLSLRGVPGPAFTQPLSGRAGQVQTDSGDVAASSQERGGGRPLLFQVLLNPALKTGPLGSEKRNFPALDYGMHRNSPNTLPK